MSMLSELLITHRPHADVSGRVKGLTLLGAGGVAALDHLAHVVSPGASTQFGLPECYLLRFPQDCLIAQSPSDDYQLLSASVCVDNDGTLVESDDVSSFLWVDLTDELPSNLPVF